MFCTRYGGDLEGYVAIQTEFGMVIWKGRCKIPMPEYKAYSVQDGEKGGYKYLIIEDDHYLMFEE